MSNGPVSRLAVWALACCAVFPCFAVAQDADKDSPYPPAGSGYVTDLAGMLSPEAEEKIERWLWQTESKTNVEIVVVTIDRISDYPNTRNGSIEEFARGLFDTYGIGNLPKNDGVLLLVAKADRKARIELGKAYGRTRDDDANRIMQSVIVPLFKKGGYEQGIVSGVQAIANEYAQVRLGIHWPLVISAVLIPILGLIAFSLFRNGKRGWGWVCVGFLFIVILALLHILKTVSDHLPEGSSDSWSSGGLGGGFGGGSSGGGGATGSW